MGITNTISRAELAAIAAAVIYGYSHIATDSLTSLHQTKKQLSHPNHHRHHIQGDVLQSIAKAIRQSPSPIHFFKVKSHAGIVGNEHADALAKKSGTTYSDLADTSTKTAGPKGYPFYNIHWLAKKDIENQTQTHNHTHTTDMAHSPPSKFWYLPHHRDALQARMHFLHKLGNAKTEANYHAYYQTLIKDGTANGATSNAYLTSSDVPFKTKCIIMKYRTDTLYNQNHAVLIKLSTSQTCPLCPQLDSALHILSGCQHTQIRNMITGQHNLACCMIFKAISKTGSLGSCVVSKDTGSNKRMTMQNLQIPETAESRILPKWLFPPRFPDKDRFTFSRPDFVLVTPTAAKICTQSDPDESKHILV